MLIALLLKNAFLGFGLASLFVCALVGFDVGGIGGLIQASKTGLLALAGLTFLMGLTFASAQIGFAVMALGRGRYDDGRGGSAVCVSRASTAAARF